jgi:hypothetical protein
MARSEIKSLTGLRDVAAVVVTIYHFCPGNIVHAPGLANTLGRAYLSVDLFFVLSGYVMARTYAPGFAERITAPSVAAFLVHRVARIYPLYLTILLFRLAYTWLFYHSLHVNWDPLAVNVPAPIHAVTANLVDPVLGPRAQYQRPGLVDQHRMGGLLCVARDCGVCAVSSSARRLAGRGGARVDRARSVDRYT